MSPFSWQLGPIETQITIVTDKANLKGDPADLLLQPATMTFLENLFPLFNHQFVMLPSPIRASLG
jgi:hypothetical protein